MCLRKLFYLSVCFQDIGEKKQSVTDARTDGRTDSVRTVYPTTNKICASGWGGGRGEEGGGGYNNKA